MINLFTLLGIGADSEPASVINACNELRESDPFLAQEASDVLLNRERANSYRQMHVQFKALAMTHQRLVEEDYAAQAEGKAGGRRLRGKKISNQFKDTNHWSRRLVEFK